jgi:hypothetical protein
LSRLPANARTWGSWRSVIAVCFTMGLTILSGAHGIAQDELQPAAADIRSWGPRVDSLAFDFSSRALWRGFNLGAPGIRFAADLGLWGYSVTAAGRWGVSVLATGLIVPDMRPGAPFDRRMAARLAVSRRLELEDATIEFSSEAYQLTREEGGSAGAEIGLEVREVPIPWLPEVWPTLHAAVLRDFGRFDGTHAELGVRQTFGVARLALWAESRAMLHDLADGPFRYRATEAGLGVSFDGWLLESGTWRLSARGGIQKARKRSAVGCLAGSVAFIH